MKELIKSLKILTQNPERIRADIVHYSYSLLVAKLQNKIITLDLPLYLIPLMNFRNCSKAGLNSPICMTNIVRWFCSTQIRPHPPQCLTSIRTPSTARPSDLSTAEDILGYLSELKCTTCICERKEK